MGVMPNIYLFVCSLTGVGGDIRMSCLVVVSLLIICCVQ